MSSRFLTKRNSQLSDENTVIQAAGKVPAALQVSDDEVASS